jgi:uncharacterized membrane protein YeaQ/YmgE (transglycosylase-associated protein family)
MHYLYLAGIGFVIGLTARVLMPGRDPMGIIMTAILGIAGSYAGGFGADYFGIATHGSWGAFGIAVAGAFALLAVLKFIRNA